MHSPDRPDAEGGPAAARAPGHPEAAALHTAIADLAGGAGADGGNLQQLAYETLREHTDALVRALASQDRIGLVVFGPDLTVRATNLVGARPGTPSVPVGAHVTDLVVRGEAPAAREELQQVLDTGQPLVATDRPVPLPGGRPSGRYMSFSCLRLEDSDGRPVGVLTAIMDSTERRVAQDRLDFLHQAAMTIGNSLDVNRTAQCLADLFVPRLADLAAVQLAEAAYLGEEPPDRFTNADFHLRRAAVASADGRWPEHMFPPGEMLPPMPEARSRLIELGTTLVIPDMQDEGEHEDPHLRPFVPRDVRSVVVVPLYGRGRLLGSVELWRLRESGLGFGPFTESDARLVEEIASRASLSVDNGRRYTREHNAAVALQRSLLPEDDTKVSAADTAGMYRPAGARAGVGGDWFDVIPLSSSRVALVVGDVAGHGLHATAMMGRLRTAVQTLADLDLPPDELLTRLDDLVQRFGSAGRDTVAATCLYAVYDPVTGCLSMASAGQAPPALVTPDGEGCFPEMTPGPPLGVGGVPFEVMELDVPGGSLVALYTDGLVRRGADDIGRGMERLLARLRESGSEADLAATGRALLRDLAPQPSADDVTLLLARLRPLAPDATAAWDMPADPERVADARTLVTRQLGEWGLDDMAFTTELIASELVTNAVRYGGGPITLRLIRDSALVCEVSDASTTQPRLRRAQSTDEGGRGLYIVAQLTSRWGCRYGAEGKTIWTEQPLPGGA